MKKIMVGIKIFQLTPSGMAEVIEFETERLEGKESQMEAIEKITDMIYKNDSLFVVFEGQSVVMHGLKDHTFRVEAVWEIEHGAETKVV